MSYSDIWSYFKIFFLLLLFLYFSKQVVTGSVKSPYTKNNALRRLNMKYAFFCFVEPSPVVNLLKNVCLFTQIVNMMQSVLNQIVLSLM